MIKQDPFLELLEARELFQQRRFREAEKLLTSYRQTISYTDIPSSDCRPSQECIEISVIIATFSSGNALIACINSFLQQNSEKLEVLVVDNGGNQSVHNILSTLPILWVQPGANLGPSEARNIGVHFSRAPLLAFIDDDAVACHDYLRTAKDAMTTFPFIALRGRIFPKQEPPGRSAPHYDMGELPLPAILNTEGNMVIRKEALVCAGGFNALLFGKEGVDLTHRLHNTLANCAIYYWPQLLIYHDYACPSRARLKSERQALARSYFSLTAPYAILLAFAYRQWLAAEPRYPSKLLMSGLNATMTAATYPLLRLAFSFKAFSKRRSAQFKHRS